MTNKGTCFINLINYILCPSQDNTFFGRFLVTSIPRLQGIHVFCFILRSKEEKLFFPLIQPIIIPPLYRTKLHSIVGLHNIDFVLHTLYGGALDYNQSKIFIH